MDTDDTPEEEVVDEDDFIVKEKENENEKVSDEVVSDLNKNENDAITPKLSVEYEVRDASHSENELVREIVFDVGSEIDSIWYLEWCAVDNDKSYCSKQSFSKSEPIKTSILTNIGYDFSINDEHNLYEWKLANFNDVRPDQGSLCHYYEFFVLYFHIFIFRVYGCSNHCIHSTL